jgi:hypothetical protein
MKPQIRFVRVAAVGSTLRQIDATASLPEGPAIAGACANCEGDGGTHDATEMTPISNIGQVKNRAPLCGWRPTHLRRQHYRLFLSPSPPWPLVAPVMAERGRGQICKQGGFGLETERKDADCPGGDRCPSHCNYHSLAIPSAFYCTRVCGQTSCVRSSGSLRRTTCPVQRIGATGRLKIGVTGAGAVGSACSLSSILRRHRARLLW